MNKSKEHLVFKSGVLRGILIYLYKNKVDYAQHVSRELRFCFCDACRKFKVLADEGLIEFVENKGKKYYPFVSKDKKKKYYRLTKEGKNIAELINKINNM